MAKHANDPIATFLSLVYPSEASRVALCLIPPDKGRPEHRFCRVSEVGKYLGYCRYRNAHKWGIYITPSVLKPRVGARTKECFLPHQRILYLDCDQPDCLQQIKDRYPYPTLVVRTSKGRHQVYWKLDGHVTVAEQERLMSAMAVDIGADKAATDVSRVLRIPSFWNRKPDRNNTVDIVFTRNHAVSYRSLSQSLSLEMEQGHTSPTISTQPRRRVLGHAQRGSGIGGKGISQSERDWSEVHRRLALGGDPNEIKKWLEQERQDKPNPRYYANRTVVRAMRQRQEQGRSR